MKGGVKSTKRSTSKISSGVSRKAKSRANSNGSRIATSHGSERPERDHTRSKPQDRHGCGAIEHGPSGQRGSRHWQREHAARIHRFARCQVAGKAEAEYGQEIDERRENWNDHQERKTLLIKFD